MATVGEIAIVVGADVGPMVRELGKGKGALSDFGNAGSKIGGILGSAMGKAALGVGAAATALVALTKASMANVDALSKQARAVGISRSCGYWIVCGPDLSVLTISPNVTPRPLMRPGT